jgi:hypothetical protein
MTEVLRNPVADATSERRIIIGLIMSTKFCDEVLPILRLEWFEVNFVKTLIRWVQTYYKKYKKAPGYHIQEIFEDNKKKIKIEMQEDISDLLQGLSEQYVMETENGNEDFNIDYYLDMAFAFMQEKSWAILQEKINLLYAEGKVEEAQKELREQKKITREVMRDENIFRDSDRENILDRILLQEKKYLFKFNGQIGNLIGGLKRGWLVTYLGPLKRGKSFWLLETAIQTLLSGLKVVFISLEMSSDEVNERIIKRIVSQKEEAGLVWYPVFDCARNQDGSCVLAERKSKVNLFSEGNLIINPEETPHGYIPCDFCRTKEKVKNYKMESWYFKENRKAINYHKTNLALKGIGKLQRASSNFKLLTYPAFSANLNTITTWIEKQESLNGFVPDLVCIDYADILAPENESEEGRDRIDHTWKELKKFSAVKKCLVVTATQANRLAIEKRTVKQTNTSEDIRKLAHIDVAIGLNQTPIEKKRGVMRISVVAHRHQNFDEGTSVTVLQKLDVGQPAIDSEMGSINSLEEREKNK